MSICAMFCVRGPSWSTGRIFVQGINGQPQPQHLFGAAQPGSQFVQLQVRELEVAEIVLVQGLSMLASARQPGGDSRLSVAEDPLGGGRVQPFGQRREHHGDLLRRGFQTVQGGVASSTEGGAAGLTAKRLDPLSLAMLAIPHQRVDVSISDPEVRALPGWDRRSPRSPCVWVLPAGFSSRARAHRAEAPALTADEGVEERRQAGQSSGCAA